MAKIRVKASNGQKFVAALQAAGFTADFVQGNAHTGLHGGCSDPGCCTQHDALYNPQKWGTLTTSASGKLATKIIQST